MMNKLKSLKPSPSCSRLQYNESERLSSKIYESSEKLLYAHFLNPCNPLLIGVIKNPFSHKSQDGPEPL